MRAAALLALLAQGCAPVKVEGGVETAPPETGRPDPTETGVETGESGGETGETGESGAGESGETGETGDSGWDPDAIPPLSINEVLPSNIFTNSYSTDVSDVAADWIELYNAGPRELSLGGLCLTDALDDPCRHALSAELIVPAGGTLLLWADGADELGPEHLPFRLDATGETLGLFRAVDVQIIDQVQFGAQYADLSLARVPDGASTWAVGVAPTPDESNGEGEGEPDLPGGELEQIPAAEDPSEAFYDPELMIEVGLELSDKAIAALEVDPYTWVEGAYTYQGRRYAPIGVRVKGENSYLPITQKASLKLKFDKYVDNGEFLGMHELTLNNMSNDSSMMHERVAYWMYRQAGMAAARANHAVVTLNDETYGLFTNLETVDEALIRRWFADAGGTLFEVHDVDFKDVYIEDFSLEYGENDRTNLQGVADAMENEDADLAWAEAAEHLDPESYELYWAISVVVGQYDSYPYGYPGDDCHVYDDPATGVLHFLPHGVDETFYSSSREIDSVYGVLSTQCLDSEICTQSWIARIWEVQTLAEEGELLAFAERVRAQISRAVRDDPNRPYELETVEYYQDYMLSFIEDRAEDLEAQVGPRP